MLHGTPTCASAPGQAAEPEATFSVERLRDGSRLVANYRLGDALIHILLIRKGVGVALLQVEPLWTPDAVQRFRALIDMRGFTSAYPGHLPVIHRSLRAEEVPRLETILAQAFDWEPPLSLRGEGAWEDALQILLTPRGALRFTQEGRLPLAPLRPAVPEAPDAGSGEGPRLPRGRLALGMVAGLAGSAAVALLLLSSEPDEPGPPEMPVIAAPLAPDAARLTERLARAPAAPAA
ncbi:hypothetical protein, partial [Falsiroseomonas oryzae]|uniref:hypothetical protein n=1 Tax=Falsiroseomonas oryzae TaxID=2766473 RepID=UPI0022EA34E9